MLRRLAIVGVACLALVACNDCDHPCKEGITFYVAELAGALSRGGEAPINVCFDGDCKAHTVTRDNVGGSFFLEFKGLDKEGNHEITVTGPGSVNGQYIGPLFSYQQDPGGECSTCVLATVKIGADGTLTPAVAATPDTTTTVAAAVVTATGG